jgi:hypothetical protein
VPVSAERRKCRRGSFLACSQLILPASANLSISGRQRMVLVEQHDLAAADQEQRAVADADPFDAGRAEGGADQRATHAAQRRVLIDLGGDGLVGELHGLVEAVPGTSPEEEP